MAHVKVRTQLGVDAVPLLLVRWALVDAAAVEPVQLCRLAAAPSLGRRLDVAQPRLFVQPLEGARVGAHGVRRVVELARGRRARGVGDRWLAGEPHAHRGAAEGRQQLVAAQVVKQVGLRREERQRRAGVEGEARVRAQRGERAVGGNVQLGELGGVQEERVRPAWVPGGGEPVRSVPLGSRQRAAAAALRQAIGKRRGLSSRALRVGPWASGWASGAVGDRTGAAASQGAMTVLAG